MRYIDLITSILCCVTFSCLAEEENSPPIGYLRTDIYAQNPISLNGTSHLTTHLFNISPAPVQMQIDRLSYQPLFVQVGTPAAPTKDWPGTDVWGPGIEKNLV